jgi:hypothetical protein
MNDTETKTFVTTTQVSVQHINEMWPLVTDQHEHDFARKAYRDGYGLVTKVRHSKVLEFATDFETGETYEFYIICSSAQVQELQEY